MTMPRTFGKESRTISSYDWFDLSTGTGYKDYYGTTMIEGSNSEVYLLTPYTKYYPSSPVSQSVADTELTLNFDLDLVLPLTIDGIVLIEASLYSGQSPGAKNYTFGIYRVDAASAEHQIGTTTTVNLTVTNTTVIMANVRIDTAGTSRLKAGETFRLKCYSPSMGGGNSVIWMHDPQNVDPTGARTGYLTSQLKLSLPIKIFNL